MINLSKQKLKGILSVSLATMIACSSVVPVFAASNSTGSAASDVAGGVN